MRLRSVSERSVNGEKSEGMEEAPAVECRESRTIKLLNITPCAWIRGRPQDLASSNSNQTAKDAEDAKEIIAFDDLLGALRVLGGLIGC